MGIVSLLRRHGRLIALLALVALLPVAVTAARGAWLIAQLEPGAANRAAVLYDVHGELLTTLGERRSPFVPYSKIPTELVNAVVATEDNRFWRHRGVDIIGIARAVIANLRAGERAQGASTVTQQLARNLYLSREKTFMRKFQEAIYAILLELRFSKRQIMELYLNRIYYGEGAYGIGEAARTYFDKSTEELTLAESALLVAVLRAPSALSPHNNLPEARERRNLVLRRMRELGMITETEQRLATLSAVALTNRRGGTAPYFVDHVRSWLVDRFGTDMVFSGDLRVWTTLDPKVQSAADRSLADSQGAIVSLDPTSGAISALVGGRSYSESQFNRATQARRQPGSAMKPFIYAAALERGWQLNDLVNDVPQAYGEYTPENFKDEYWGTVTLKHALTESLNNGSVWLLQQIGVGAGYEMARRLGLSLSREDRNLALALGGITHGVTPLALAAAYVPFANGGVYHPPFAVREVQTAQGEVLYRHQGRDRRVLSPEVAYFITDMLQDAVNSGTGVAANIGRPQAGKTGTTNGLVSAWFVGYTPQLVASVYVGEDDRTPLNGGGGTLAAPIWGRFALEALQGIPVLSFTRPSFVVDGVVVDIFTGLRANEACAYREVSSFVRGQEPQQYAPCSWGVAQRPQPTPDFGQAEAPWGDTSLEGSPPAPPTPTTPDSGDTPHSPPSSLTAPSNPDPATEGAPRLERAFDAETVESNGPNESESEPATPLSDWPGHIVPY